MEEELSSSETSVLTRATRRNFPEVTILHSHSRENLKPYIVSMFFTPALWLTQPPLQFEEEANPPGIQRPGREAHHSPPTSAEDYVDLYVHFPILLHCLMLS
jgi:hypothetical protein